VDPMADPPGGWGAMLADLPELMIPGPAALHDETREILGSPLMAHYGRVWPAIHHAAVTSVGAVLGCRDPFLVPGTGSAALDAAMLNLLEPGQRAVVPDTGYFGARLADIARAQGLDVAAVPVPTGEPVSPERVADAVAGGAHAVLCVHVETSTGVRHPVEALAGIAAGAGAAFVVDAIASAGGETLSVDGLGADAVVTASQKGLDAPPGIGVVALSERGRERLAARVSPCPSWYFDLRRWERHRREDAWEPHPVTMPTTVLIALLRSARRILAEGVAERVRTRSRLAGRCRDVLTEAGLRPVAAPGHQANLVVAAWTDRPEELADHVARAGDIMIAQGLGPTGGRAIRVGLVGRTATESMVERLRAALLTRGRGGESDEHDS
jgi:alanine-glyoxylate transaminase / serine-glyoxylate transaminase / serine-pyruvate transaminase